MGRRAIQTLISTAVALAFALTLGTSFASGWGSSSSSWSSSGSGSSLNLNLTFTDCTKCHISPNNVTRHHDLLANGKQCLDCHKMEADNAGQYTVQVVRDCQQCHTPAVHDQVQHTVVTCSRCHGSDILDIHSGWRSSSTSAVTVCYLCHTSTDAKVKATITKGVSGQTVYCQDCHGNNPHSWDAGSWGR